MAMESIAEELAMFMEHGEYQRIIDRVQIELSKTNNETDLLARQWLLVQSLVANIALGRFCENINAIEAHVDLQNDDTLLIKAYCHYRLKDYASCFGIFSKHGDLSANLVLLKAQCEYKAGRFNDAVNSFLDLLSILNNTSYVNLVATNYIASLVKEHSLHWPTKNPNIHPVIAKYHDYEIYFNMSLLALAQLQHQRAIDSANMIESLANVPNESVEEIELLRAYIKYVISCSNDAVDDVSKDKLLGSLKLFSSKNDLLIFSDLLSLSSNIKHDEMVQLLHSNDNTSLMDKFSMSKDELFKVLWNALSSIQKKDGPSIVFDAILQRLKDLRQDASPDECVYFDFITGNLQPSSDTPSLLLLCDLASTSKHSSECKEKLLQIISKCSDLALPIYSNAQRTQFVKLAIDLAFKLDGSAGFLRSKVIPLLDRELVANFPSLYKDMFMSVCKIAFCTKNIELLPEINTIEDIGDARLLGYYISVCLSAERPLPLTPALRQTIEHKLAMLSKAPPLQIEKRSSSSRGSRSKAEKKKHKRKQAYIDKLRKKNNGELPPLKESLDKWTAAPKRPVTKTTKTKKK